ncbi:MAG: IS607 family transposase [Candidatus Thorarchaeota archaeon]|nr:IS607 family transposase [Candidatus Thorarchaeota archaeon]
MDFSLRAPDHSLMFSVSQAARRLGVCPKTIRRWHATGALLCYRTPGGHRRIPLSELERLSARSGACAPIPSAAAASAASSSSASAAVAAPARQPPTVAVYARVSSHRQARDGDLARQQALLLQTARDRYRGTPLVVTDVGSGLNMRRRRGLLRLLRAARDGRIHTVLITHRDRLARFAVSLLERLLSDYGVQLVVLYEAQARSPQEELVADLMALLASFSGRVYGLRAASLRRDLAHSAPSSASSS